MARPTQKEIEEWEARMNEPDEPDPDDFEVVLFDENGNPVGTMPFARAKAYFAKRGIELDDPADSAPGGNGTDPNAAPSAPPVARSARPSSRYFAGKGARNGGTPQPNAIANGDPSFQPDPTGNPPK